MFLLALSDMKQGAEGKGHGCCPVWQKFVQVILLVVFADKGFGVEAFALQTLLTPEFSCWGILLILRS